MNVREAELKDVPTLIDLTIQSLGRESAKKAWFAKLCIEDEIMDKEHGLVLISEDGKGALFADVWKKRKDIEIVLMVSPTEEMSEAFYVYLLRYCKKHNLLFITAHENGDGHQDFYKKMDMYPVEDTCWIKEMSCW